MDMAFSFMALFMALRSSQHTLDGHHKQVSCWQDAIKGWTGYSQRTCRPLHSGWMTPGATVERLRILKRDSCDTESAENGNGQVLRVDYGTADVSFHPKVSRSLVKNFLFSILLWILEVLAILFSRDWCIIVKVLSEIGTFPLKDVHELLPEVCDFSNVLTCLWNFSVHQMGICKSTYKNSIYNSFFPEDHIKWNMTMYRKDFMGGTHRCMCLKFFRLTVNISNSGNST